jgi:hypothetical protein
MLGPYPTVYRIPLDNRRHADEASPFGTIQPSTAISRLHEIAVDDARESGGVDNADSDGEPGGRARDRVPEDRLV